VPYDWGFTSILYNTDKVKTPIDPGRPSDPAYKDHISMGTMARRGDRLVIHPWLRRDQHHP
jgi:hypothetical protein